MKKIWNYVSPEEILDFYSLIDDVCEDSEYDSDDVIDAMYELDLKNIDNPAEYVYEWIQAHKEDLVEWGEKSYGRIKYAGEDPEYDENGEDDWRITY